MDWQGGKKAEGSSKEPTLKTLPWKQTDIRKICFKLVEAALMRKTETCTAQNVYHCSWGLWCGEIVLHSY